MEGVANLEGVEDLELGGLEVIGVEAAELGAEEKVDMAPSTRFAFLCEANRLNSTRNLDGDFGSGAGG